MNRVNFLAQSVPLNLPEAQIVQLLQRLQTQPEGFHAQPVPDLKIRRVYAQKRGLSSFLAGVSGTLL